MNACEHALILKGLSFRMTCTRKTARCGYHKPGQWFTAGDILPQGLCPEAYHHLYYISLGLLFRATFPEQECVVKCPGEKNFVVFEAHFVKLNLRLQLLNLVKRLLYRVYPGQIYRGHLVWKVVRVEGDCTLGHLVNDQFPINLGNFQITKNILFPLGEPESICPAVFDQVFPLIFSWTKNLYFPYSEEVSKTIQCPDHRANITLTISEDTS